MSNEGSQSKSQDQPSITGNGSAGVQAEQIGRFQSDFLANMRETNHHWVERANSEVALAQEPANIGALFDHQRLW